VVTVLGHAMAVHDPARDKYVTPSLVEAGCIEPFETEIILNEVRPGDTVVDVGAHIGYYTLLLARAVGPAGRVLAFEPDPLNFALLRRNVELNGYANVELFPKALSDRCGKFRLYLSSDNAGDHRLYESADEPRPAVEAEATTLDSISSGRDRKVDFIKMDVQGSEGAVLEGMVGALSRATRLKMTMEFWPLGLARAGYGAERLLSRLEGLGFRLYEIEEQTQAVRRTNARRLLERLPNGSEQFTNLLCTSAGRGETLGPDRRTALE
jgi:FkbM family methyltransferase